MNHCLIQAVINSAPQMRYTKENQTPIAEMIVNFKGLRSEDPTRELKILGWGNIAQEMIDKLKEGQNIVIEGSLRMNSVTRKDGTKEKQPELTASKIHQISPVEDIKTEQKEDDGSLEKKANTKNSSWDSSPLVPEVDEIPF
jgi:single-stranded DNA-binding protein